MKSGTLLMRLPADPVSIAITSGSNDLLKRERALKTRIACLWNSNIDILGRDISHT